MQFSKCDARMAMFCLAYAAAGSTIAAEPATAYPTKPIRVVVPFAPGGGVV